VIASLIRLKGAQQERFGYDPQRRPPSPIMRHATRLESFAPNAAHLGNDNCQSQAWQVATKTR
ncbi:hypothetical protein, partial [Pseudomonas sp. GL-B-16]|uniref:hypothetical protein n=1 Tax=Pseudomonas sp. GL-B-16 TaxID=2832373 RepID=UPI001CC0C157